MPSWCREIQGFGKSRALIFALKGARLQPGGGAAVHRCDRRL